ncbi:DUF7230 family protein [Crenobacter oryzisoli]|uniref:DUF7230 family protein n=1 Tax=Crenobacter oryzisoli TaxID=3056844 RepID=UPI003F497C69
MESKLKRVNPVAKFAQQLHRCAPFRDRKKQARQGYAKHKKREVFTSRFFFSEPRRMIAQC